MRRPATQRARNDADLWPAFSAWPTSVACVCDPFGASRRSDCSSSRSPAFPLRSLWTAFGHYLPEDGLLAVPVASRRRFYGPWFMAHGTCRLRFADANPRSIPPHQPHQHALDLHPLGLVALGRMLRVLRLQFDPARSRSQAFERGRFAIDQGHHDFARAGLIA